MPALRYMGQPARQRVDSVSAVYLLWHDPHDYESGLWLRGVYISRKHAEADLPIEIREYGPRDAEGEKCITVPHDEWCCSIEAVQPIAAPHGATMLPQPKQWQGERLIPKTVEQALFTNLLQPSPYRRD